MKLLVDEHYSNEIAEQLRAAEYDVVTVSELRMKGVEDEPLLTYAASQQRALLTNNVRDFSPIAVAWVADGRDHQGLIFTDDASMPRAKATIGLYVAALRKLMEAHTAADALRNQIRWLP